jgi:Arc/MetJ-type ribon-helix-helix transcriptional regulator
MTIRLNPELAAVVEGDLASAGYPSVEEYIAAAVELLHERVQGQQAEELDRFEDSISQADRGDLLDEEELRRRIGARKMEWAAHSSA